MNSQVSGALDLLDKGEISVDETILMLRRIGKLDKSGGKIPGIGFTERDTEFNNSVEFIAPYIQEPFL